jgi:diacylglycerol kinase (ATP)
MQAHKNQSFHIRLRFAWNGLIQGLRSERSLQFHAAALALVLVALLVLRPGPIWWALVILASVGVFAAELFNTVIERLADHLHPEIHPQIQMIKDGAAAAVLVAALGALAVALALLIHLTKSS